MTTNPRCDDETTVTVAQLPDMETSNVRKPEDITAARSLLLDDLLGDYQFEDDASRAHAVAAILQPFLRDRITGTAPLHIVESASPGTGKTMFCELVSIIAGEDHLTSYVLPSRDVLVRKWITTVFNCGINICLFDHFGQDRRLSSKSLYELLTNDTWTDRLLGTKEIVHFRNNVLWLLAGNNPQITRQFDDCIIRIRLTSDLECPWLRQDFKIANLVKWTREHREELANAVRTLIRTWEDAGQPMSTSRIGNHDSWSGIVGGILEVAGIPGFLENRNQVPRIINYVTLRSERVPNDKREVIPR